MHARRLQVHARQGDLLTRERLLVGIALLAGKSAGAPRLPSAVSSDQLSPEADSQRQGSWQRELFQEH
jgi:hypothetical protein